MNRVVYVLIRLDLHWLLHLQPFCVISALKVCLDSHSIATPTILCNFESQLTVEHANGLREQE